jgi:uncharacterized membrane protein YuzA (DUF378 family)
MSVQRILGVVLIVGGLILTILGITASESLGDRVSKFFTGHFTEATLWYLIGGIAAVVIGLVLLIRRFDQRKPI